MVIRGSFMEVRAAQITLLLLLLCNTWTELISKAVITWLQSCCRPARLILPTYCPLERTLPRTALCSRTPRTHAVAAGRWKGVSWTHAYNNPALRAGGLWLSAHRQDHRHLQDPHHGPVLPGQRGVQPAQGRLAARGEIGFKCFSFLVVD